MSVSLRTRVGLASALLLGGCVNMADKPASMKTGTGPCHLENTCTGPGNAVDLSGLPALVTGLAYAVGGGLNQSRESDWDAARRVAR
jgi:hypothetical protein